MIGIALARNDLRLPGGRHSVSEPERRRHHSRTDPLECRGRAATPLQGGSHAEDAARFALPAARRKFKYNGRTVEKTDHLICQ